MENIQTIEARIRELKRKRKKDGEVVARIAKLEYYKSNLTYQLRGEIRSEKGRF